MLRILYRDVLLGQNLLPSNCSLDYRCLICAEQLAWYTHLIFLCSGKSDRLNIFYTTVMSQI